MSTTQLAMLILGVVGLTILMLSTRSRVRRSRQSPRSTVRERYAQSQQQKTVTRDVEQVMLELDQLSRQIHGRLDTRLARLEAVIRDADERIDELSRLVRTADGGQTLDVTLKEENPNRPPRPAPDAEDGRHAAVHRLADVGLSVAEIAREAGQTTGEIELILALRRVKEQTDSSRTSAAAPTGAVKLDRTS